MEEICINLTIRESTVAMTTKAISLKLKGTSVIRDPDKRRFLG